MASRTTAPGRRNRSRDEGMALLNQARNGRWHLTSHPWQVLGPWYRYGREALPGWHLETRRGSTQPFRYRLVRERTPAPRRGIWPEVFGHLKRVGATVEVPQKPHAAVVALARWRGTHPDFFARVREGTQGGTVIERIGKPAPKGPTRVERLMALVVGEGFSDDPGHVLVWRTVVSQAQRRNRRLRWRVRYRARGRTGPSLEIIRVMPQRRRVARLPAHGLHIRKA